MSNWNVTVSTEDTGSYYCSEIRVTPPKVTNSYRAMHSEPEMRDRQRELIEWQLKRQVVEELLEDPVFAEVVRERTEAAYSRGMFGGNWGVYG